MSKRVELDETGIMNIVVFLLMIVGVMAIIIILGKAYGYDDPSDCMNNNTYYDLTPMEAYNIYQSSNCFAWGAEVINNETVYYTKCCNDDDVKYEK